MIRINLLPRRKKPRKVDKGQQSIMLGFLILIGVAALVYFLVHKPMQDKIAELERTNAGLRKDNDQKKKKLKGFKELKDAVSSAEERSVAIVKLSKARAIPAHMLHELGNILTSNRLPTMTKEMTRRVEKDPNRELAPEWDPKHIWMTDFKEKKGRFEIEGGAQSDGDMTQLAKRLQASVYFEDVIPEKGEETLDKDSGITYYKFTISGNVVY